MNLTAQQETAMARIRNFIADADGRIFILKGYAGTGKTTLIGKIVEYLHSCHLKVEVMAPTGRAAKVLRSKLGDIPASTVHRKIYEFSHIVSDEEGDSIKYIFPLKRPEEEGRIYIVDEASMISSVKNGGELLRFGSGVLINDLLEFVHLDGGSKVIFVGDPMQLPPVDDMRSVALDENYFKESGIAAEAFELTDIVRQDKDSCILKNAMMLRDLLGKEKRCRLVLDRKEGEVVSMEEKLVAESYCGNGVDSAAIVCYSNRRAWEYNIAVRDILFPEAGMDVVAGDRLMVVANSYYGDFELLNGDMLTVVSVSDRVISQSAPVVRERNGEKENATVRLDFREITLQTEEGIFCKRLIIDNLLKNRYPSLTPEESKALYINLVMRLRNEGITDTRSEEFMKAMRQDKFYNALQVKFGYAFTCHKAQGGEWKNVYVDFCGRTGLDSDSLRWKYTAVTRASGQLWCINLNDITPLSSFTVKPIDRTSKIPADALSFEFVEGTPFHDVSSMPAVRNKYWTVVRNMTGTSYSVKNVECRPWRDIYEVDTPEGIKRVDALYTAGGVFTKYLVSDSSDNELLDFFTDEEGVRYKIDYRSSIEALQILYARMSALCDDCGIVLTNIVEKNYTVVYYMKASGDFASLTFYYNGKGRITYASPLSDIGGKDTRLSQLIEHLKD